MITIRFIVLKAYTPLVNYNHNCTFVIKVINWQLVSNFSQACLKFYFFIIIFFTIFSFYFTILYEKNHTSTVAV